MLREVSTDSLIQLSIGQAAIVFDTDKAITLHLPQYSETNRGRRARPEEIRAITAAMLFNDLGADLCEELTRRLDKITK